MAHEAMTDDDEKPNEINPEEYAAVIRVEYSTELSEDGGGATTFGLDEAAADAVAGALLDGVDKAVAAGQASERLHEVANGLIRSLHKGAYYARSEETGKGVPDERT